ncbi:ABC transporter permease [Megalodesulfovibrio paquesii]
MRYIDEDGTPVTVYTPNERQGGLLWGIQNARQELHQSRHVIHRLFWRDFLAQFRQKILGYLWALLGPLIGVLSFLFLYAMGVLRPGDNEMPYTLYVMIGSNIWGCLPGAMALVSSGLQSQADLIMRTRVPKIALAVSSLSSFLYGTFISMITTLIVFLAHGIWPSPWFFAYPLLILPMLLLGTALGLVLSVLGSIARDLTPMATQFLSLVMYITPVVYVQSTITNPVVKACVAWNPLTYLVDVPRSLVVTGEASSVGVYLLVSLVALALLVVGLRVFYLLEDLVAERL